LGAFTIALKVLLKIEKAKMNTLNHFRDFLYHLTVVNNELKGKAYEI